MKVNPAEVRELIRIATTRTGSAVFDEDLTQEVSMRALEAFRRVGHVEHPRAFLMKIVRDAVRDHWRRRKLAEDIGAIDEKHVCFYPRYEEDLDRRQQTAQLRTALSGLAESKRRLLRLFYEEDLPVAEIARLQGCSVSAVKMQLLRTRQELARNVDLLAKKKSRSRRH